MLLCISSRSRSFAVSIIALFMLTCSTAAAMVTEKSLQNFNGDSNPALGKPITTTKGIAFMPNKRVQRSLYGLGQKMLAISHSKIPIELDLLVDDFEEDGDGRDKRYDDYGHMRFGKRGGGKFDDYGHMRFGRSI